MARLERFELPTHCLEGSCSIRLSYRRILCQGIKPQLKNIELINQTVLKMERVMGIEPTQPAWKAGILAVELHPHIIFCSQIADQYIIPKISKLVNSFLKINSKNIKLTKQSGFVSRLLRLYQFFRRLSTVFLKIFQIYFQHYKLPKQKAFFASALFIMNKNLQKN